VSLLRLLTGPADTLALEADDASRLSLDLGAGQCWKLKLDRRYLVYESAELRTGPGKEILARVTFDVSEYRSQGPLPWPMTMVVDQPGEPWKLKLKFSQVQLGTALSPEIFKLKVPEGTTVREVE
jgi:hypothetical protein